MSLFPLLMNTSDCLLHQTVGDGTPSTSQVMSMVNPEYVVYVLGKPTMCAGTETRLDYYEPLRDKASNFGFEYIKIIIWKAQGLPQ